MRAVTVEFNALRLRGMANAWTDSLVQGTSSTASSAWLIEHLLRGARF